MLLVNLRMDAMYVKENMHIKWASEMGIVENITAIVKEFKTVRALPVSILMYIGLSESNTG